MPGVQPGWQVLVWGMPSARPLLEEVTRQIGRRGAYPLLRLTFGGGLVYHRDWLRPRAADDRIARPAPIDVHALETCDALLAVSAPENTPRRRRHRARAHGRGAGRLPRCHASCERERHPVGDVLVPDAGAGPGRGDDAGRQFEDFLYGACLLDWSSEHRRLGRYAALFDQAEQVRIVGEGTDLTLSLAGRRMEVDAGTGNMPGGEFFGCPVETSAEGTIAFTEFPAVWQRP